MSQHPLISQDPLQDPCLRSHVSASLYLRILCKIHVSGSMSQHLYISGASARSMSPIHVLASLSSDFVALRRRNANFDLRRRVLCGPAQGKQSGRDPPPETPFVWPCAGKTVRPSVSRRRNANLTSRDASCVHIRWIHEEARPDERKPPRRYSETPKKIRAILTSGVAFFVALRSKKRADRKFAPRPKRLYPYRKNPSVCHTVWGTTIKSFVPS